MKGIWRLVFESNQWMKEAYYKSPQWKLMYALDRKKLTKEANERPYEDQTLSSKNTVKFAILFDDSGYGNGQYTVVAAYRLYPSARKWLLEPYEPYVHVASLTSIGMIPNVLKRVPPVEVEVDDTTLKSSPAKWRVVVTPEPDNTTYNDYMSAWRTCIDKVRLKATDILTTIFGDDNNSSLWSYVKQVPELPREPSAQVQGARSARTGPAARSSPAASYSYAPPPTTRIAALSWARLQPVLHAPTAGSQTGTGHASSARTGHASSARTGPASSRTGPVRTGPVRTGPASSRTGPPPTTRATQGPTAGSQNNGSSLGTQGFGSRGRTATSAAARL